jgi:hypothetical protein
MQVAGISFGCCKSKFGCCNGCIHMFQAYVLSASFIFRCMFQVLHLDVSKEDLEEHMLQWSRWLANTACRSHLLLLRRRRGAPCGCLRSADAYVACICRRGR